MTRGNGEEWRLLIVSSEPAWGYAVARSLREAGWKAAVEVLTPQEALGRVETSHPSLVILDMPSLDSDGAAVVRKLRQADPPQVLTPILALCEEADPGTVERAITAGASHCFDEAFGAKGLLRCIRTMLGANRRLSHHWTVLRNATESQTRALDEAYLDTLTRLCRVAELRDDSTGEHTFRVGRLSGLIAQQLHLSPEEVRLIMHAAPVHDIGKVVIPDRIILKRDNLDRDERDLMRRHTTLGAEILGHGPSELLRTAEAIAAFHHERWDGGGYPRGLAGEDIPLSARIVAAADSFDAMTHDRPYKGAASVDAALGELRRERSWQFDPDVVDALLRALEREKGSRSYPPFSSILTTDEAIALSSAIGGAVSWGANAARHVPGSALRQARPRCA